MTQKTTSKRARSNVSLATYSLRVLSKDNTLLPLQKFDGESDLMDVLEKFFNEKLNIQTHVDLIGELHQVSELKREDRSIRGKLRSGRNGFSSELVNAVTMASAYSRQPDDVELLPFYFLVHVLSKQQNGNLPLAAAGNTRNPNNVRANLQRLL